MLDQHLLNTKNYTQLTSNEAIAMHEDFAFELTERGIPRHDYDIVDNLYNAIFFKMLVTGQLL